MLGDIVIINNRHMGDVLMASAAVRLLRSCCPHARMTLMVPPATIPLVNDPALVDEVVAVPSYSSFRSFHKTLDALRLRFRHYDACFYFGESATNAKRFQWLSGIPVRVCASLDLNGSLNKAAPSVRMSCPRAPYGRAMWWTGSKTLSGVTFIAQGKSNPPLRLSPMPCLLPLKTFFSAPDLMWAYAFTARLPGFLHGPNPRPQLSSNAFLQQGASFLWLIRLMIWKKPSVSAKPLACQSLSTARVWRNASPCSARRICSFPSIRTSPHRRRLGYSGPFPCREHPYRHLSL